jgi:AcrR family transcriptional regulator
MPSQTFYNLPEPKKKRIIAGAMKEFSQKSLNEASISNIVKNAEISRGSFYQYFEDKKDLYFFLIGKFQHNYRRLMLKCFKENDGDFYEGYREFGKKYIKYIRESEKFGFFENMYLHMNYQINQEAGANMVYKQARQKKRKVPKGERIVDAVNHDHLIVDSDEEIIDILRYILNLLNDTIMEGFWKELTIEETQELFVKRLGWISYGVLKEKS